MPPQHCTEEKCHRRHKNQRGQVHQHEIADIGFYGKWIARHADLCRLDAQGQNQNPQTQKHKRARNAEILTRNQFRSRNGPPGHDFVNMRLFIRCSKISHNKCYDNGLQETVHQKWNIRINAHGQFSTVGFCYGKANAEQNGNAHTQAAQNAEFCGS